MKRILLFAFIMFSGFILSACDLIPTDVVDELSEELCRENPSHELCTIEDLSTLQESAVEALVLDAVDTLSNNNPEVCDTVFAITNTDLLDACTDGTLLPEGVETFTVIESMQDGDTYIFKGATAENSFLEIRVTVGNVDGNTRITSFETMDIEDPTPPMDATTEELIYQLFDDYQDDLIDWMTINDTYFGGMMTSEDEAERDETLTVGQTMTITSIEMTEDGMYKVTFDYVMGEETGTDTVIIKVIDNGDMSYLEFHETTDGEDNDCDSNPDMCTQEDPVTLTEFEEFFNLFVSSYLDEMVSDEELASMYLGDMMDEEFKETRDEDLMNGTMISVLSVMELEMNLFQVELEFKIGDDVKTDTVKVKVNRIEMALVLVFDGVDDDCDSIDDMCEPDDLVVGAEAEEILNQYFVYYTDSSISNQAFADMYFGGYLDQGFADMRTMDLDQGVTFTVLMVYHNEDGSFDVEYQRQQGDDIIVHKRPGRIRRRPDLLVVEWDELIEENLVTDLGEAETILRAFILDYLDPDIDNDTLSDMYFGGMDSSEMLNERQTDLIAGVLIEFHHLEPTDMPGIFNLHLVFTVLNESFEMDVRVKIKRIDAATPMLIFLDDDDDGDGIPVTDLVQAEEILLGFLDDFNNTEKTTDELMMKYMMYSDDFMIQLRYGDILIDGVPLELEWMEPMMDYGDGMFFVQFFKEYEDGSRETVTVHATILITYDNANMLFFYPGDNGGIDEDCDLIGDFCEVVTDPAMAVSYFNQFLALYNDATIPLENLEMYVLDYFSLLEERQYNLENNISVTLIETNGGWDDDIFLMTLEFNTPNGIVHRDIAARIYHQGSMMFIRELHVDPCELTPDKCYFNPIIFEQDLVHEIFMMYLQDFVNPDITFDEINEMYFMSMAPDFLTTHRNGMLQGTVVPTITDLVPASFDSFFDISYSMTTDTGVFDHMVTIRVLMTPDGMYHIEYFDEDNVCHVDPDSCYGMHEPFETDIDVISPILDALFLNLNDATVSDDMIQEEFFGWMAPESLLKDRGNGQNGAVYVYQSILPSGDFQVDSFFDISYEMTLPDGTTMEYVMTVRFIKMDMGLYIEPMYDDMMNHELENAVYMLFELVSQPDVTTEELCAPFTESSQTLCMNLHTFHANNQYMAYVENIMHYDDGSIEVTVLTQDVAGMDIEVNIFRFSVAVDNPLFEASVVSSENPLYTEQ